MKVNGKEWMLDDELSERWPIYTRGNVGEVFPDTVTPLNWSLVGQEVEDSWRQAWKEFGIVARGDFDKDRVLCCIAGGYCYLNMSYIRLLGVRVPGGAVKAVDNQILGEDVTAPKYIRQKGDNNLGSSFRLLWDQEKTLRTRRFTITEKMSKFAADWVEAYPGDDAPDEAFLAYIHEYRRIHNYLFGRHILNTFRATNASGAVAALCAMKVKDPGLTLDLMSGVEGVESAEPARMLWEMGRMVRVSSRLTAVFESGVTRETLAQLRTMPDATDFLAQFDDFIARYGYRGPNEWEFMSKPWRMRPETPLKIIDRLRQASADKAPGADYAAQKLNRQQATRYARRKLAKHPMDFLKFRKALPAAKVWQILREASKSAVIRALDSTRRAMYVLANRVAERHGLDDPDGMFMLHIDELEDYVRDPRPFLDRIVERRKDYDALAERIPPFIFEGEIPPLETWKKRAGEEHEAGTKGDILEGVGGAPGRVVGIARVVLDASDPDILEPGDILVAPITDPSWTPLFLAAAGVVVDVGAVMSHAVIVARDLGIPCAVSVTDATRIIPDGALIEVDGDTGAVSIIATDPDPATIDKYMTAA